MTEDIVASTGEGEVILSRQLVERAVRHQVGDSATGFRGNGWVVASMQDQRGSVDRRKDLRGVELHRNPEQGHGRARAHRSSLDLGAVLDRALVIEP